MTLLSRAHENKLESKHYRGLRESNYIVQRSEISSSVPWAFTRKLSTIIKSLRLRPSQLQRLDSVQLRLDKLIRRSANLNKKSGRRARIVVPACVLINDSPQKHFWPHQSRFFLLSQQYSPTSTRAMEARGWLGMTGLSSAVITTFWTRKMDNGKKRKSMVFGLV